MSFLKPYKQLFLVFLGLNSSIGLATAQVKVNADNVKSAEALIDIQLTDAERDSLLDEANDNLSAIRVVHGYDLKNSVTPAFRFDPIPTDRRFDTQQRPVVIPLPKTILPANREDLAFYTLPQLAYLIQSKQISSVALTQFFINRLKKHSDTLHCTISLLEESALKQAAEADAALKKGIYKGILHGIPYGVKDLLAVKNTYTTWGAAPYKTQVIDETATVVQKLNAAGAVLVVKLSLGSLAMGDVWHGGRTRNPWDLSRGSSGSSAGSASATVAGLVPFAIGSETLGSIVSPSTVCGATGLRPTFGRVSRSGAMTLCWSLDKLGPITRSAEDAAIVLNAIKGSDGLDNTVRDVAFNYTPQIDIKKLRIAYPTNVFDSLKQDRNEWQTLKTLEKMGATLIPMTFKTSISPRIIDMILMPEAAAAFDALTRTNLDDALTSQQKNAWPNYFRAARFIPAIEYINANRLRTQMIAEIDALIRQYDVIVTSNFDANQLTITNLTGHPVCVVPNGFINGRPTSVTFLGNYFDEATILGLAKAYQNATDFDEQHPEMFKK